MPRIGDVGQPRQRPRPPRQHGGDQGRSTAATASPDPARASAPGRPSPAAARRGRRPRPWPWPPRGTASPRIGTNTPSRPTASTGLRDPRDASACSSQASTCAACASWRCGGHPLPRRGDHRRGASRPTRPRPWSRFRSASTVPWVESTAARADALGQGGRGAAGRQPQADLQREDRRLDAVDRPGRGIRHRVIVPNRVATERLGVLSRRRYQSPSNRRWPGMWWRSSGSRWLKVHSTMIRPSSRSDVLQSGLELVAGRGRGFGAAEGDDEATDPVITGRRRSGQRQQRRWRRALPAGAAATVAWSIEAIPVVRRDGLVTPNSPRNRLIFKMPAWSSSGLKALRGEDRAISAEILALRDCTHCDRVCRARRRPPSSCRRTSGGCTTWRGTWACRRTRCTGGGRRVGFTPARSAAGAGRGRCGRTRASWPACER